MMGSQELDSITFRLTGYKRFILFELVSRRCSGHTRFKVTSDLIVPFLCNKPTPYLHIFAIVLQRIHSKKKKLSNILIWLNSIQSCQAVFTDKLIASQIFLGNSRLITREVADKIWNAVKLISFQQLLR